MEMAPRVVAHPEAATQGGQSLSTDRVHPETRAGDPIAYAADMERIRRSRRTEGDLIAALMMDERALGRPHTPGERDAFARGFFGQEYGDEIRLLAAEGLLDDEDGQE
jgi:hypothetical protein